MITQAKHQVDVTKGRIGFRAAIRYKSHDACGVLVEAGRTAKAVLVNQVKRLRLDTRSHQFSFPQERGQGSVALRYMPTA